MVEIGLTEPCIEVEFERDQADAALKDAYEFIRERDLWDEFMATAFNQEARSDA